MRLRSQTSIFTLFSLLPALVSAYGFDCNHIVKDGIEYNLGHLGGVHSLYHVDETEEFVVNTTYVLNICTILKSAAIRGDLNCGTSKNICGFEYRKKVDGSQTTGVSFPIAGLDHLGHGDKVTNITRLKEIYEDKEGLLVKMVGGEYIDFKDGKKKSASAVIEFECDPDRSGLEGIKDIPEESNENEYEEEEGERIFEWTIQNEPHLAEDDETGNITRSLQFKSFGPSDDGSYVLRLDWRTRYACDNYLKDRKDNQSSGHWGFLTWLIMIIFLCIAAYLIFGSWLNYNRYGARGWDLLPHGDTIRDIPYIFQDWLKRIINSLQGTGSRGGYSAV
ncbi:hypothetical protein MPDQ_002918 [Monascus purpureus]|uniref:Autophagy-related protein 27 n=1 Tax=Monascus purpureus TaxID=5098 RepID=A0A507QNI7_MONPU|nr:hypothetical protein MPDQ_002918 [Monascus purpureus]